jgi:hypothetical protein
MWLSARIPDFRLLPLLDDGLIDACLFFMQLGDGLKNKYRTVGCTN